MSNIDYTTDVAIIGAGPVGLFAAFEAGMLKMQSQLIDTLDFIGGQCTALYPEKPIYDIPAWPEITGENLIRKLEEQIAPFGPTYHLNQQVTKLTKKTNGWEITTSTDRHIHAKAIIIAAGCGAFGPNRPPLADIASYEQKSVFYMVKKKEDFRGKHIVIAGGGDSAADWAIALADIAASIAVVHRRPHLRCSPESADKLKKLADSGKISLVVPYQLAGLEGQDGYLTHVIVKTLEGQTKSLPADILLPFFGLAMTLGPIAEWGLALDKNHIAVNPATMETSEKGIYAIGDMATYPGKLKLILSGFAEAAMACHASYAQVFPGQALHFEYSTTKGVPG